MGGLASTAFWPASLKGLEWFGWRDTLLIFAALEIALACRCICSSFRRAPARSITAKRARSGGRGGLPSAKRRAAFRLAGDRVCVQRLYRLRIDRASDHHPAGQRPEPCHRRVWVGTFFGPMQVAGRLLEFAIGRRFASRSIGIAALSLLVAAVVVRACAERTGRAGALLFAVLFGGSNGVVTIVRGAPCRPNCSAAPGSGGTLGNLAAPALFARAIALFAFAPLAVAESAMVAGLSRSARNGGAVGREFRLCRRSEARNVGRRSASNIVLDADRQTSARCARAMIRMSSEFPA